MQTTTSPSTHEEAWNIRLIGHSDLNGHGDCMHVNLKDGFAFVGHMGESRVGTSVVDVSDPSRPARRHPTRDAGRHPLPQGAGGRRRAARQLRAQHVRAAGDRAGRAGSRSTTCRHPPEPRELAFLAMPGKGVHRMTYWEPPYAYMSGSDTGFLDQFLVDRRPVRPVAAPRGGPLVVSRARTPAPVRRRPGRRPSPREARPASQARGAAPPVDPRRARVLRLVGRRPDHPRHRRQSRTAAGEPARLRLRTTARRRILRCPVPGRDLLVVTDEQLAQDCKGMQTRVRMVDIADERNPRVVSEFPVPEGDYCLRGGRFGPHNVHEMRPGTLADPNTIYVTCFNAGLTRVSTSPTPHLPRRSPLRARSARRDGPASSSTTCWSAATAWSTSPTVHRWSVHPRADRLNGARRRR